MNIDSISQNLSFSFLNSGQYKVEALALLNSLFSYDQFIDNQEKIIEESLEGRDSIIIMPPSEKRSICYLIPSLVRKGVGLIITSSKESSIEKCDSLKRIGLKAECLKKSFFESGREDVLKDIFEEKIDFLVASSDSILVEDTLKILKNIEISLITIDDAQNSPGSYSRLSVLRDIFPHVPRVALTKIGSFDSREELRFKHSMTGARVFFDSINRTNINYEIELKNGHQQTQLLNYLERFETDESGIIFCQTDRLVQEIDKTLQSNGFNTQVLHKQLGNKDREKVIEEFVSGKGVILLAKSGLELNFNKKDVRFVIHLDLPKSIDRYYHESSLAGIDGERSYSWLLYNKQDSQVLNHLIRNSSKAIEEKKVDEFQVDLILGLCESTNCRRSVILKKFNIESNEYCGHCDICQGSLEGKELVNISDEMILLLNSISICEQRLNKKELFKFLMGDEYFSFGEYASSPYFGQGESLDLSQWKVIYRVALASNLINIDFKKSDTIQLSMDSFNVLEGREGIYMRSELKS